MPIFRNRQVRVERDAMTKHTMTTRPWEQPEQREKRNAAPEVDEHLSDLGIYLRDKFRAVMAYFSGNGKDNKDAA
jgi:hypothetical protein